ncbi:hypothetical protein DY000_02003113 [Brassica cretica]|uniref:Uncharacterized protein n=1 Tax=Brassica cretica TaxID=69181 RepID=A0ABQ7BZ58_BRACR|nr:hypothetical protein DY000_02003113 [Brassica cretica]
MNFNESVSKLIGLNGPPRIEKNRADTCRIGSSGREEQSGLSVGSSIGCAIGIDWSSVRQDANISSSRVPIGSSDRLSFYRVVGLIGRIRWLYRMRG